MIHYQLQCSQGHGFDGWFRDSLAFDAQAAGGLVECPVCADTAVTRAMMAPALGRQLAAPPLAPPEPKPPPASAIAGRLPDQVRATLQRLRAEVERDCEHVGPNFAAEARRIHDGEAAPRGIYGDATPEQAEALAEDGIEVARIPWLPRADG